jgi:CheY-like chemotaxis protein
VEDEYFLRINAVLMIEDAGFDVLEAASADQAIEILEARPDVTVIFIPGSMDGLKLAYAVRGRWPPIKIIATSGRVNLRTALFTKAVRSGGNLRDASGIGWRLRRHVKRTSPLTLRRAGLRARRPAKPKRFSLTS